MSDEPFIGEIMLFAGTFAPRGWAFCDGQLLPVSENTALFSILGTSFGGDGRTTFGLPDLRGRVPMHAGSGPGLTPRRIGEMAGEEQVVLTEAQIPSHSHEMNVLNLSADNDRPTGDFLARSAIYSAAEGDKTALNPGSISMAGSNQAHENMQPSLCINFVIALVGIYPSRN